MCAAMGPSEFARQVDPNLEKRRTHSEKTLRLLKTLNAAETFDSVEHRKSFLERVSYDEFKHIGILINDAMRGQVGSNDFDGGDIQVRELHAMSGVNVADYIPPDPRDKEELLKEVLDSAKTLEPHDAGLLIALGINGIHPFADGNGRSARVMYSLLADGYDESQDARTRISELSGENGREYFDPNTKIVHPIANFWIERTVGMTHTDPASVTESWSKKGSMRGNLSPETLDVSSEVSLADRKRLVNIVEDRSFRTSVFYLFLKERDMLKEPYIVHKESEGRFEREKRPDKWTTIEIDTVLRDLSMTQIGELLEVSRQIRKLSIQVMIQFFTTPEKFKIADGRTVKEYFEETATKKSLL